jgi:hypothetical protein
MSFLKNFAPKQFDEKVQDELRLETLLLQTFSAARRVSLGGSFVWFLKRFSDQSCCVSKNNFS